MTESSLRSQIRDDASTILQPVTPALTAAGVSGTRFSAMAAVAASSATEDLHALAGRDAAAKASIAYVYESYLSFGAVLAYRVANVVHRLQSEFLSRSVSARLIASAAHSITERAKVETGVDIHPGAQIGRRFVVDHGYGTVIGEQVEIGDDCYCLQNVILGGRSIGYSSGLHGTRRHPRLGHRVEIDRKSTRL